MFLCLQNPQNWSVDDVRSLMSRQRGERAVAVQVVDWLRGWLGDKPKELEKQAAHFRFAI